MSMVQLLEHGTEALELGPDEAAARRSLRAQIAHLEAELASSFVTAYEQRRLDGVLPAPTGPRSAAPRLLDLGELEALRDRLAARAQAARRRITDRADQQELNRALLEDMRLRPHLHRFRRLSRAEVGQPGCGVYRVKPRLGLIGMLMGWWHVKLSSGCPLST